jgi:hypothetical protein
MDVLRKVLVRVIVLALGLGLAFGVVGFVAEGVEVETTRPVLDDAGSVIRVGPSSSGSSSY